MRPGLPLGIGIASVIGIGVIAGLLLSARGWVERQQEDPALRERVALDLLGAERLPEGYRVDFLLSVPRVNHVVALGRPASDGGIQAVFLYVTTLSNRLWDEEPGQSLGLNLDGYEVHFELQETLLPVALSYGPHQVRLLAYRGTFQVDEAQPVPADLGLLVVDCAGDPRPRRAVWATAEAAGPGLRASDPDHVQRLLAEFRLCREVD